MVYSLKYAYTQSSPAEEVGNIGVDAKAAAARIPVTEEDKIYGMEVRPSSWSRCR